VVLVPCQPLVLPYAGACPDGLTDLEPKGEQASDQDACLKGGVTTKERYLRIHDSPLSIVLSL